MTMTVDLFDAILAGFSAEMILIPQTVFLCWFLLDLYWHHSGNYMWSKNVLQNAWKCTISNKKIQFFFWRPPSQTSPPLGMGIPPPPSLPHSAPPFECSNPSKPHFWLWACFGQICKKFVFCSFFIILGLKHSQSRDSGLRKLTGIPRLESIVWVTDLEKEAGERGGEVCTMITYRVAQKIWHHFFCTP